MSHSLTLSVIIPTYNRAHLLRETLKALALQSRPANEIIVVDNNSTDDTKVVVSEFTKQLPITYVFEPQQGVSYARNAGLKQATGEIIVFTDDDCLPEENWLHYMELPFMRDPSIGLVGGRVKPRAKELLNHVESFSAAIHVLYENVD